MTAAVMYAVVASMTVDGAKKTKPDTFNPYRTQATKPSMSDLFGALRQMKAERDKAAQPETNGAV